MMLVAEMSNVLDSVSGLPVDLEFTSVGLVLVGFYALCMLAGLAIDFVVGARFLASRNAPGTGSMAWSHGIGCLTSRPWTWREATLILIVLLSAQLAMVGIRRLIVDWGGMPADSTALTLLCQGVGFHGIGLAALAWSIRRRRISWAGAFGMQWQWREAIRRTGQGMICYLAILPLVFLSSLAYQLVLFCFGYPLSIQNVVLFFLEPQSAGVMAFLLVLALFVAPLTEEGLFRGIALPLLARTTGAIPAIVLTAAGFALIHFHVPSLVPLFVLASGFAVAYIVTRSLWVPVVMHALFNGMNIALLLLGTER